jgi:hypothetical protein
MTKQNKKFYDIRCTPHVHAEPSLITFSKQLQVERLQSGLLRLVVNPGRRAEVSDKEEESQWFCLFLGFPHSLVGAICSSALFLCTPPKSN